MFGLMTRRPRLCGRRVSFFAVAVCLAQPVYAQRAGENAVTAADDAFGTSVGSETLGLYSTNNARGFSPGQAGNVRIEGLYFDQQASPSERLVRGSTVRVGISAQAYAFPAPTGIADFQMRLPGDKQIVSTVFTYGPYTSALLEVDGQVPITDKISLGLGASVGRRDSDPAVISHEYQGAVIARARPNDVTDATAFYSRMEGCNDQANMFNFTSGPWEPPHLPRRTTVTQPWTRGDCTEVNTGAFGRTVLPGDFTVRGGVFRSVRDQRVSFGETLRDIDPITGLGNHQIFKQPPQKTASNSGEVRVSKLFSEGPRRHTATMALRGRDVKRDFGGSASVEVGPYTLGVFQPIPEPVFNLGPTGDDHSKQGTVGLSYEGLWAGVGGLGIGLQKTFYHREIVQPPPTRTVRTSNATPLLYDLKANIIITSKMAAYISYTKGLEESGSAPPSSLNRGEAMPVSMTKQIDAGVRYAVTPRLTFVAGVFQVEKPYFNINHFTNIYGNLGTVTHQGIEISMAGQLLPGLRTVGGLVLIDPRVSGTAVDQGTVGPISNGVRPRTAIFTLQYQPASWRGFGVEGTVNHSGPQINHQNNDVRLQGNTQLNLGMRYNFKAGDVPASLRFQAQNITDVFAYQLAPSSSFNVQPGRRFVFTAAADF